MFVNLSDAAVTFDFAGDPDVEVAGVGQSMVSAPWTALPEPGGCTALSDFNDIVIGSDADNSVDPLEGDNLVLLGAGDDFMTLSSNINHPGRNIVGGGAGNDVVDGGYGDDIHWGGPGDDQIFDGNEPDIFSSGTVQSGKRSHRNFPLPAQVKVVSTGSTSPISDLQILRKP